MSILRAIQPFGAEHSPTPCFSHIVYHLCYPTPQIREEKQHVKLPMSLEDAKQLGRVLTKYRTDHYPQVLALVTLVYILYPFTH